MSLKNIQNKTTIHNNRLMKITYLNHSGFLLEDKDFSMLIDYYNPSKNKLIESIVKTSLKNSGKFYILSSHSHPDHFDAKILDFKTLRKDIKYIFSKDIEELIFNKDSSEVFIEKFEQYEDNIVKIKAFGSTDIGISFFIESSSKKIFHAGDLNNWHWNEEFTEDEIKEAEDFYHKELRDISLEISELDLAMFPIDPRLGTDYMKGAIEFIDKIHVKLFSPMHFQGQYEKTWVFDEYAKSKNCILIKWKEEGDVFYEN